MQAYLITWTTYGTWLHGDERGSVSVKHNTPRTPSMSPSAGLCNKMASGLMDAEMVLSLGQRVIVDQVIREHCDYRSWRLCALNVRMNHVHVVVQADAKPEKAMGEFKSWASRRLREVDPQLENIWTRHGSTRWLDSEASVRRAIEYVLHEQ